MEAPVQVEEANAGLIDRPNCLHRLTHAREAVSG